MIEPKVPVAKEGYPFIFLGVFLTLVLAILGWSFATFLSLVATIFTIYFFRDPERFTPIVENGVISPADGKIIVVEKVTTNPFIDSEDCYKISIFMNVFNVHVNRIPIKGTIEKIVYKPGEFYSADSQKGAEYNESCASILKTETGQQIAFVQVAGLIARRIVNWLELGDTVETASRFGLIRFGSRVDLYLPADAEISVAIGQKVTAAETVIAKLR